MDTCRSAILTYFEVIQVSIQLLVIFGHAIFPVVLEVVGQTIVKEHGALLKKRQRQHMPTSCDIPPAFGSNLEQGSNAEFHIAHAVLDRWIRALVARGGRHFPRVF